MAQPRPIVADVPETKTSRRRIVIPVAIGVVILILAIGIPYLVYASRHVSTDDAQIDGNITTIAPKVKGQVSNLYVEDNSIVHKGDILVQIDDRDLKDAVAQAAAARAQADAGVAQGQSGIANAQATLVAARAQLAAAQANLVKATNDQRRAHELVVQGAISQSEADATQAAYQSSLAAKDA